MILINLILDRVGVGGSRLVLYFILFFFQDIQMVLEAITIHTKTLRERCNVNNRTVGQVKRGLDPMFTQFGPAAISSAEKLPPPDLMYFTRQLRQSCSILRDVPL